MSRLVNLTGRTAARCLLVFLVCLMSVSGAFSTGMAQEQTPPSGPRKTINVEFVVDASGSMAAATDTGELRITAAQRVLQDVVAAIPEADGINVGLRVYGHQGDNTDAGRATSCQSTELLVPVNGVDKAALSSAVSTIQPVGWTPLGLALEAAGADFTTPADENTVNAIVLVTDGLETCDGDPVRVAESLRSSELGITTYVIGFGTTAEELDILNGIASGGGGQLLGAQNAQELNAALFSILEDLEIVVGTGFIGGNAFDILPPATPGEVSVIGFGGGTYGAFPIVARNDTGQDVSGIKVSVTIRGAGGDLLASGDTGLGLSPRYVRAGGVAIGSVYLGPDLIVPPGAQIDFDVTYSPASLVSPFQPLDMTIVEASLFDNRIVGTLENGHEVGGQFGLTAISVCFDLDGTPLSADQGFIDRQTIAPGEQVSFQIDLLGSFLGIGCPAFLVAAYANSPASMPPATNLAPQQQPMSTVEANTSSTPESASGGATATPSATQVEETATVEEEPPYPLPTQDPTLANTYSPIPGVQDAVARMFESPTDLNLFISAVVAQFDSSESAKAALPVFMDRAISRTLQVPGIPATQEPVDLPVPDGFDMISAVVFNLDLGGGIVVYQSSVALVRQDRLYVLEKTRYEPGFDESVLETLISVALNPLPREQAVGELTYGLWGALPVLAEVPAGYVLSPQLGNYVPRSFGPIPPSGP